MQPKKKFISCVPFCVEPRQKDCRRKKQNLLERLSRASNTTKVFSFKQWHEEEGPSKLKALQGSVAFLPKILAKDSTSSLINWSQLIIIAPSREHARSTGEGLDEWWIYIRVESSRSYCTSSSSPRRRRRREKSVRAPGIKSLFLFNLFPQDEDYYRTEPNYFFITSWSILAPHRNKSTEGDHPNAQAELC